MPPSRLAPKAMTKLSLRGLAARKLRALTTLAGGLPRRRADGGHLRPHGHDQPVVRPDLQRVAEGHRCRDHNEDGHPAGRHRDPLPGRAANRCAGATAWTRPPARSSRWGGFVDDKGDPIGTSSLPTSSPPTQPKHFESLNYVKGSPPKNATEATLDKAAADDAATSASATPINIAGEERSALPDHRAHEARRHVVRGCGHRAADPPRGAVHHRQGGQVRPDLGGRVQGRHADRAAQADRAGDAADRAGRDGPAIGQRPSDDIADQLKLPAILLLVFAGVSLFVGAFLIFNTFSITVAQRTREFGLLRTLGASRGQVLALGVAGGLRARRARRRARPRSAASSSPRASTHSSRLRDRPAEHRHRDPRADDHRVAAHRHGGDAVAALAPALRATRVTPMAAIQNARAVRGAPSGRVVTAAIACSSS